MSPSALCRPDYESLPEDMMTMTTTPEYTHTELAVLHYLKRNGPMIAPSKAPSDSILTRMRNDLGVKKNALTWTLNKLENRCLILRTYDHAKANFNDGTGYNPVMRLELIDPDMELPKPHGPAPVPLAVVLAQESDEMYRHQAHEPTADEIVEALLNRINELQGQVDKLADIVSQQAEQIDTMTKAARARPERPDHLTNRIRNALTPEQWESLHHGGQRP